MRFLSPSMQDGTYVGQKPHTTADEPNTKKAVSVAPRPGRDSIETTFRLRCPDCGQTTESPNREFLVSQQRTEPCPNCDRMMALSEADAQ